MANRPSAYGLTKETQEKINSKYDFEMAQQAVDWMKQIVGEPLPGSGTADADSLHEALKDGQYLCKLMNVIQPSPGIKFTSSKMAFKQMENIGKFLDACIAYGVSKVDLFQTVDLYEAQNMTQVVCGIHALGRKGRQHGHPGLGPKESAQNKRDFTEEQLKAGQGVIGLQMGSNKGASQSGQNFGKTRSILD